MSREFRKDAFQILVSLFKTFHLTTTLPFCWKKIQSPCKRAEPGEKHDKPEYVTSLLIETLQGTSQTE